LGERGPLEPRGIECRCRISNRASPGARMSAMQHLRDLALGAFFLWIFVDGAVVFRHRTPKSENRDRLSLLVIAVASPLVWWLAIACAFDSLGLGGAINSRALQIAGLSIMAFGILVRSAAIRQLGRLHTPNVALRRDHELKDGGIYRYVRHPSYLGALIALFGFSLALGNWWSVAAIATVAPCIYLFRIREEEAALSAGLGAAYRDYCARTKRLIPWIY